MIEDTTLEISPNKPASPNAGMASRFAFGHHWPGVGEPGRFGMSDSKTPNSKLTRLLALASGELRSYPNDGIMSPRFDNTHDVAAFIEQGSARLSEGDVTAGHELLMIFLPTSAWDDAGGSQDIANRLCDYLEPYFISKRSSSNQETAERLTRTETSQRIDEVDPKRYEHPVD